MYVHVKISIHHHFACYSDFALNLQSFLLNKHNFQMEFENFFCFCFLFHFFYSIHSNNLISIKHIKRLLTSLLFFTFLTIFFRFFFMWGNSLQSFFWHRNNNQIPKCWSLWYLFSLLSYCLLFIVFNYKIVCIFCFVRKTKCKQKRREYNSIRNYEMTRE